MHLFLLVLIGLLVPSATAWAFGLAEVPGRRVCSPRCPRLQPVCLAVPNAENGDVSPNGGVSPNGDVPPSLGLAEILKLVGATEEEKRLVEGEVRSAEDLILYDVDEWEQILSTGSRVTCKKLAIIGEYISTGKEVTSSTTMKDMVSWQKKQTQLSQTQLPTAPPIQNQSNVLQGLPPFDLSHINSIELDTTWIDFSYGMSFVGRADFSKHIASTLMEIIEKPPTEPKKSRSLVYSTVSGSGKTVSMLHLKTNLPPRLDGVPRSNIVVAYLGFNTNLEVTEEEWNHMAAKPQGGVGAQEVLARRLLGSVLLSNKYPDAVSLLPSYDQVYEGRGFPTVDECKSLLFQELGASPDNPFYIVAGVDEVQTLDNSAKKPLGLDVGLGCFFLRILRRWQVRWRSAGLVILPLGTGVTLDFYEKPTIGSNEALSGGDAVLISKEDFKSLAETAVDEAKKKYEKKFHEDFGHDADRETLIAWMVATFWPRVRVLEYLKEGDGKVVAKKADPNQEKWPIWLAKWMRSETMSVEENTSLLPGTINGEVKEEARDITALFHYSTESKVRRFSVVPDGYSSSSMITALKEQMPVPMLYDGLDVVASMNPADLRKFMPQTAEEFEKLGFHALGTSLYIGLHALDAGVAFTDPSQEQHRRLGLALWIHYHTSGTTLDVPVVLGPGISSEEAKGDYYPFENSAQTIFVPTVKTRLPLREPLYIHTGRLTCFDYVFLYPSKDGHSWVAIIVDAKSTVKPEDSKMTVTGTDQANLFKAAVCLHKSLKEAGMSLTKVRLFYLTNRDGLAESEASKLEECKAEAKNLFEGLDLEPLTRTSFEFPPYSDMLFSRQLG